MELSKNDIAALIRVYWKARAEVGKELLDHRASLVKQKLDQENDRRLQYSRLTHEQTMLEMESRRKEEMETEVVVMRRWEDEKQEKKARFRRRWLRAGLAILFIASAAAITYAYLYSNGVVK